jgi:hypothetical protein
LCFGENRERLLEFGLFAPSKTQEAFLPEPCHDAFGHQKHQMHELFLVYAAACVGAGKLKRAL